VDVSTSPKKQSKLRPFIGNGWEFWTYSIIYYGFLLANADFTFRYDCSRSKMFLPSTLCHLNSQYFPVLLTIYWDFLSNFVMNVAQFFDQVSDWMVDYHTPGGVDKDGWQVIGRFFCIFVKVPKIGQELLLSSLYIYSSKPLTLHLQFYILVLCITYLHCGKNIISSFYFNKTCQPPCGQYKSVDFISKRNLPCSLYISVDFI